MQALAYFGVSFGVSVGVFFWRVRRRVFRCVRLRVLVGGLFMRMVLEHLRAQVLFSQFVD